MVCRLVKARVRLVKTRTTHGGRTLRGSQVVDVLGACKKKVNIFIAIFRLGFLFLGSTHHAPYAAPDWF